MAPPPEKGFLLMRFVDRDAAFTDAVHAEFAAEIEEGMVRTFCGEVGSLPTTRTAFVSPSNSLMFFDGGYDAALLKMFPGLQTYCRAKVKDLGLRTALSRYYLPIGSALVAPTGQDSCVIASPTMFLPHDVSRTRNAYHSLMAAMMVLDTHSSALNERKFDTLVIPAMCCGYGKMTHVERARCMTRCVIFWPADARKQRRKTVLFLLARG